MIPAPMEVYRHFKGNLYQIITLAEDSENGNQLVVYKALYGEGKVYARELKQFMSDVDRDKYPQAMQTKRFELLAQPGDVRSQMQTVQDNDVRSQMQTVQDNDARSQMQTVQDNDARSQMQILQDNDVRAQMQTLQDNDATSQMQTTQDSDVQLQPQMQALQKEASFDGEEKAILDPIVEKYLDSDTYEEKIQLLQVLHNRITDEMITTMAVVSDIEIPEGTTEERYKSLRNCLLTLKKYECSRLR